MSFFRVLYFLSVLFSLPTKADCAQAYIEPLLRKIQRQYKERGKLLQLLNQQESSLRIEEMIVCYFIAWCRVKWAYRRCHGIISRSYRYSEGTSQNQWRSHPALHSWGSYSELWFRRKLMSILDTLPVFQRIVNIDSKQNCIYRYKRHRKPSSWIWFWRHKYRSFSCMKSR